MKNNRDLRETGMKPLEIVLSILPARGYDTTHMHLRLDALSRP
jgi:hypothetical protein